MTRFDDYEPSAEWIKQLTGDKGRSQYEEFHLFAKHFGLFEKDQHLFIKDRSIFLRD